MFQLQKLTRLKTVTWPVKILFVLVIISFIFFYGWSKAETQHRLHETSFARLRTTSLNPFNRWRYLTGEELTLAREERFNAKMSYIDQELMFSMPPRNLRDKLVTPAEAAEQAANNVLLDRTAERLGLTLSFDTVLEMFRNDPNMTLEQLQRLAYQAGFQSVEPYVEYVRRQIIKSNVQNTIALVAQTSLYELWQEYLLSKEKFTLDVAAYPFADYAVKVQVTDEALERYLAEHRERFALPARRRYAYVRITQLDMMPKVEVSEDEIAAYYEQHKQERFTIKAGALPEQLFIPLTNNADATRALELLGSIPEEKLRTTEWRTLAEDLASSAGIRVYAREMGWLPYDIPGYSPAFIEMLKTLPIDTITTPGLEGDTAYRMRIKNRREESVVPLEDLRQSIIAELRNEKSKAMLDAEYQRLRGEIGRYGTLHEFAVAMGLEDRITSPVARTQTFIPDVGSFEQDREYLMSLRLNQMSNIFRQPDQLVILQVVEELPPDPAPPLDAVRPQVFDAYRRDESIKLARAAAEQALRLLQEGAAFEAATADAPQKAERSAPFTRQERVNVLASTLLEFPSQSLSVAEGSVGLSTYGLNAENTFGVAVWKVVRIEPPTIEEFERERYEFAQKYLQIQRLGLLQEWLRDQRRAAAFTLLQQ